MPKSRLIFWIIAVMAIAFTARFILFSEILVKNPAFFGTSIDGYLKVAENLVKNGYYGDSNNELSAYQTPLYPFFIAILLWSGLNPAGVIFVQILVASLTCLIVILMAYKLTGNWIPACLAGGIVALDIPSIVLANCPLSETLFTFVFTLSILYLVIYFKQNEKISALIASSILMGLAILCRPIALYFPCAAVILFFIFTKMPKLFAFRRFLLYLMICLIIISPWLIRNQIVFGSPFLSSVSWRAMFESHGAGVYSVKNNIPIGEAIEILRKKAEDEFKGDPEKNPIEYLKFQGRMGTSIVLSYPFVYCRNSMTAAFYLLFKPIRSYIDIQLGFSQGGTTLTHWGEKGIPLLPELAQKTSKPTIVLVVIQLFMLVVLWIAFIYGMAVFFIKKEYIGLGIIIFLIGYLCILAGGSGAQARYRVPIVPFWAMGSGFGIWSAYTRRINHAGAGYEKFKTR